ncbi:hypothetical protein E4T56_gene11506 [Termitomyces sp. T112]|nr:hypothetical protein E4T56_gene11506 [Termitomyces sp. T112]KAH0587649.1 hypothetical protein H2248_006416 [Termitomyces sp. 'cryptogamus']
MSSPSHPLTSSPTTITLSEQPTSPTTPSPSLRPRNSNTTPEPSSINQPNEIPRSTLRSIFTPYASAPEKRFYVRSDPSLLTCFDPRDKELYELWAPQH